MGTNYYLHEEVCPTCNHPKKVLHIGKSSFGWTFALHVIPEEKLNSLEDWEKRWERDGGKILDEYGAELSGEQMLEVITTHSGKFRQEGRILQPPGKTWDLLLGDFS